MFQPGTLQTATIPPGYYVVRLNNYTARKLRSPFHDTNHVAIAAQCRGQLIDPLKDGQFLGDVGEGTHELGLKLAPVRVDAGQIFDFCYAIVNHGSGDPGWWGYVAQGVEALITALTSGVGATLVAIDAYLRPKLTSLCDGTVAGSFITIPSNDYPQDIAVLTDNSSNSFSHTISYPGTDSPWGCGDNSYYDVNWTITRVPPPNPITLTTTVLGTTSVFGTVAKAPTTTSS